MRYELVNMVEVGGNERVKAISKVRAIDSDGNKFYFIYRSCVGKNGGIYHAAVPVKISTEAGDTFFPSFQPDSKEESIKIEKMISQAFNSHRMEEPTSPSKIISYIQQECPF